MKMILPEGALIYLTVFWPIQNAFLFDLALSLIAIYIYKTKTPENMLQQAIRWYAAMQLSSGAGDKRGTNI